MSTLKVTNIQATGETASRPAVGMFNTYLNLNQDTSNSVRDSFNISSNTDNSVGSVTITYTNDMGTTSDYITFQGWREGYSENVAQALACGGTTNSGYITASSQRCYSSFPDIFEQQRGIKTDLTYWYIGIIGDLA